MNFRKLLLSTAAALTIAAPAFASSGHIVTHYKLDGAGMPNGLQFIMDDDGTFNADGTFSGTVYCVSLSDPGASLLPAMFDQSKLFGYDLTQQSQPPVMPIFFNVGTPAAQISGTNGSLHPADCPISGTVNYVFAVRK